jgi:hypothetical protein
MEYTVQEIKDIVAEACQAAQTEAELFFQTKLGGRDQYACGFAWVNILGIKGNTKLGRAMKQAGVRQDYTKAFQIWNPSGLPVQNVDCKEVGAEAAAKVLQKYGFTAYAGSRLD